MRLISVCGLVVIFLLSGCAGTEIATVTPISIQRQTLQVLPETVGPPSVPPDCAEPSKAQQIAVDFLESYNKGDVDAVMKMIAPDLRQYIDAPTAFVATRQNFPDLRPHLVEAFAAHDKLNATKVDASVEPSRVLIEYTVRIPDVTRTNDTRKGTAKGQIEMAVRCDTLLFSLIAIETR